MKMNKKGFTLIEMLVVIAIIAILVSIIIPTVSNSTTKATAAANAANLRSLKAEMTTQMLVSQDTFTTSGLTFTAPTGTATAWTSTGTCTIAFKDLKAAPTAPTGKTFTGTYDASKNLEATIDGTTVTVKFDGLTITDWGMLAE